MRIYLGMSTSLLFAMSVAVDAVHAQQTTTLNADGPGNTYELVNSVFGSGAASEVPDLFPTCNHAGDRHIREDWDSTLNRYVFLFDIHVDSVMDYDRCSAVDRQRNEIKTVSPPWIIGHPGETHLYRWKFKMDTLFQPSPNFCHLFQIKATGGSDDGAPLMTITPRKYSDPNQPEWLQLIFTPSTGGSGAGTVKQVELQPLKGIWLEVTSKVIYADDGKYEITIRMPDGTVAMHYVNYLLDMYRAGANFHRGKWGIYRSLNSPTYLRDETVAFADFAITEGENNSAPSTPGNLAASVVAKRQINLAWEDRSDQETNFQIQRSPDGINWTTIAVTDSKTTSYSDKGLADSTRYYYRVRAENWNAYSSYSDTVNATTFQTSTSVHGDNGVLPQEYLLYNAYPNPFNPTTRLRYQIPEAGGVRLEIFNTVGQKVAAVVDEFQQAGRHEILWNATARDGRSMNAGTYFARLQVGGFEGTVKLLLIK